MILRLEPFSGKIAGSSDGFLDDTFILTTSRNPVNNDIAESLGKLGKLGICLVRGFLEVGNLTGNRLSTGQQLRLLVTGCFSDSLAESLLFCTQVLMGSNSLTTSLICGDNVVHNRGVLAAGGLGATNGVRIRSQELGIDHVTDPTGLMASRRRQRPRP